ncbi:MAG: DUF3570 domain-containing protein [Pseudomonadales bacterium]|nr:DUF3570 domain-containing protein [Pseudomonadales bacterium]
MSKQSKNPAASKQLLQALGQSGLVAALAGGAIIASQNALAEAAPESAQINLKTLSYQDYQGSGDRIDVDAESLQVLVPIAGQWSISGTAVHDAISGASPRYHSSSLTDITDKRNAYSATVTRYFTQGSAAFGGSYSKERDYISRNVSAQGTYATPNQNTSFIFGLGYTKDDILPNSIFLDQKEHKKVFDMALGVTQVITQNDIGQINYHHTHGTGYFSDQYKLYDSRPDSRNSDSVLLRWNHHFTGSADTLRTAYRYYQDSNDIRSHTLEFEYDMSVGDAWRVTPLLRYYSQTAASFYFDPVANDPWADADTAGAPISVIYPLYVSGGYASMDQRLSAFGALTYGLKVSREFGEHWIADVKFERYEQKGSWALGSGSKGLDSFGARSLQFGIRHTF